MTDSRIHRLRRQVGFLSKKLAFALAVVAGMSIVPANGFAQELGLTPSHVVSLWVNVNNALVTTARISSDAASWHESLARMSPKVFSDKKPADVLEAVVAFRGKLDRLRQKSGLKATGRYGEGEGRVTPSVVFLNSGLVLDGLVHWVVKNTGPDQLVSGFYTRHDVSGKTPSDAFGQVDLANRRIDKILATLER